MRHLIFIRVFSKNKKSLTCQFLLQFDLFGKMVFVTAVLIWMKSFGVLPDDHVKEIQIRAIFWFLVCSLPLMFILIPNIVYLVIFHKLEKVYGLTDLMYTIIMFIGVWNGYLIIAVKQISIRDLLNELKLLVSHSEY